MTTLGSPPAAQEAKRRAREEARADRLAAKEQEKVNKKDLREIERWAGGALLEVRSCAAKGAATHNFPPYGSSLGVPLLPSWAKKARI